MYESKSRSIINFIGLDAGSRLLFLDRSCYIVQCSISIMLQRQIRDAIVLVKFFIFPHGYEWDGVEETFFFSCLPPVVVFTMILKIQTSYSYYSLVWSVKQTQNRRGRQHVSRSWPQEESSSSMFWTNYYCLALISHRPVPSGLLSTWLIVEIWLQNGLFSPEPEFPWN